MVSDVVIVGVTAAVGSLISTVILAWMQKSTQIAVERNDVKLDVAEVKRGEIHDLVNSNYSGLADSVKSANDRLEAMQGVLDKRNNRLEVMQGILDKLIGEVKLRNGDHPVTQAVQAAPVATAAPLAPVARVDVPVEVKIVNPKSEPVPVEPQKIK